MHASLRRLASLADELIVCPGHDYGPVPSGKMGNEKAQNMMMRQAILSASADEFAAILSLSEHAQYAARCLEVPLTGADVPHCQESDLEQIGTMNTLHYTTTDESNRLITPHRSGLDFHTRVS